MYLYITGILLIGIVVFFETQIEPIENKCVCKQAKSTAINLVHQSFEETVNQLNFAYTDIADIQYSESGDVKSIETKSLEINRFKSTFLNNFQNLFDEEKMYTFDVPLGLFTNINALNNAGPDVEINFRLTGSVNCEINSKFESAGVNQTVHRIYLTVNASIITFSPGYSKDIKFSTDYEVAQTVIVGNTPSIYLSSNN